MKFRALPIEVEAFQIINVEQIFSGNSDVSEYELTLDNDRKVLATAEMCSRHVPKTGDFWVIQSDGYSYLNPQHVFLRKYERAA